MPRKPTVNKRQAVIAIAQQHPGIKPAELIAKLADQGIKMGNSMASTYLSHARKMAAGTSGVRVAKRGPRINGQALTVADVESVRVLVERLGRETVEQLARQFG